MSAPATGRVGTVRALALALHIPVSTINRYAREGAISRVGSAWPPRYDAGEVARVRVTRRARTGA